MMVVREMDMRQRPFPCRYCMAGVRFPLRLPVKKPCSCAHRIPVKKPIKQFKTQIKNRKGKKKAL
jgi:hypothetical protein